jgi:hypothetical protein
MKARELFKILDDFPNYKVKLVVNIAGIEASTSAEPEVTYRGKNRLPVPFQEVDLGFSSDTAAFVDHEERAIVFRVEEI